MNEKLGHRSYPPPQGMAAQRAYSEATAEMVDEEARALAREAYDRTLALLTEKKELTSALAQKLLEKEVILKDDVVEVPIPGRCRFFASSLLTYRCSGAAAQLDGSPRCPLCAYHAIVHLASDSTHTQ